MMKNLILLFSFLIVSFSFVNLGFAEDDITVQGTLIDTRCYGLNHSNSGTDHLTPNGLIDNCASICAKMGIPVGLLVDGKVNGKVYLLVVPAPALANYMGEFVRVMGKPIFKNGIVIKKIEVKKDDKFEEIKIINMM